MSSYIQYSDPKRDDPFAQFRNEEVNSEGPVYEEKINDEQAYTESEDQHSENEPMLENSVPAEIEENEISEDETEVEVEQRTRKKTRTRTRTRTRKENFS